MAERSSQADRAAPRATKRREPHPSAPGLPAGIDEDLVRSVVEVFYAKIRLDPLLGPVFEGAIKDWPTHLGRLCAFWSSLTLLTGRYKGNPFEAHLALPELDAGHFATWLRLFDETLAELCTPVQAEVFRTRAQRVAESLRLGLEVRRGDLPPCAAPHGATSG